MDLTITVTLTIVISCMDGALFVSSSKSINGWVSTSRVPGVGLDVWVIVTVLVVLGRVVAKMDWVLTELDSGGNGGKSSNKLEHHIYNLQKQL